jgi:peroxiredoxin/outer membrane lipoprotein-sorting protein
MVLAAALLLATSQDNLESVVGKVKANLQSAKALSMTVRASSNKGGAAQTWSIKALRPNLFRVESENQLFLSDGQMTWQLMKRDNRYNRMYPADPSGMSIPLADGFQSYSPSSKYAPKFAGMEQTEFNGRRAYALVQKPKEMPNLELRVFIDASTYLPIGSEQKMLDNIQTAVYEDLRLDAELKPADFMWLPPEGAIDANNEKVEVPYPKAGEVAPAFQVELVSGKKANLADLLKKNKAVVLNFWFINCGYCQMEMPHLDEMYKKLKSKGIEVVAVNDVDSAEEIKKFWKGAKYGFAAAIDEGAAAAKAYKVANAPHPVTFLIDANGQVAYMQPGFDTKNGLKNLREAIEKLGIK